MTVDTMQRIHADPLLLGPLQAAAPLGPFDIASFAALVACARAVREGVLDKAGRFLVSAAELRSVAPLAHLSPVTLDRIRLDLRGAAEDGISIAMCVASLPRTLSCLELGIACVRVSYEDAHALVKALPPKLTCLVLDLQCSYLGAEGTRALVEGLPSSLKDLALNLRANWRGEKGAHAIASALPQTLERFTLDLTGNNIMPDGACALATALSSNLKSLGLHLKHNRICNRGTTALATALTNMRSLEYLELDLAYNKIGAEGVRNLAAALRHAPKMFSRPLLRLEGNPWATEAGSAIEEALEAPTSSP